MHPKEGKDSDFSFVEGAYMLLLKFLPEGRCKHIDPSFQGSKDKPRHNSNRTHSGSQSVYWASSQSMDEESLTGVLVLPHEKAALGSL